MLHNEFLELAFHLARSAGPTRPKQIYLRRAISSAYYALFHAAARTVADLLVGKAGVARESSAWTHVYRSLDHRRARDICANVKLISDFPIGVQRFANAFLALQDKRHAADYKPTMALVKPTVLQDIQSSGEALRAFFAEPAKDRQAFAILLLLGKPRPE